MTVMLVEPPNRASSQMRGVRPPTSSRHLGGLRDGSEMVGNDQFAAGHATAAGPASTVAHVFRSPPPRGRRHRLLTVALLLCSMAVLAMPAGAQEVPTEAPTAVAVLADPILVSGRDTLVLPLPAQATAITATVTDGRGEIATWTLEPPAEEVAAQATPYALDLEAPAAGAALFNGIGTLTVAAGDATLVDAPLTLDRDPAAPNVSVVHRDGTVTLLWGPVSAPGSATYRVQRAPVDGQWSTLVDAAPQLGFTHKVDPGRYRYRVNALVPAARTGFNFSADSVVDVRVVQQEAPVTPQPPAEETVKPPAAPRTPKAQPASPRRKVAATGAIRRPVLERRVRRGSPDGPTLQPLRWSPRTVQRIEGGPSIASPRLHSDETPVVAPPLARFVEPLVGLPPAGTLAVEAAHANGLPAISPASWLTAAALAGMLLVSVRRRRTELSLVPDGHL